MLQSMGFGETRGGGAQGVRKLERAADWLFSRADDLDAAVAEAESAVIEPERRRRRGRCFYRWAVRRLPGEYELHARESHGREHRVRTLRGT